MKYIVVLGDDNDQPKSPVISFLVKFHGYTLSKPWDPT